MANVKMGAILSFNNQNFPQSNLFCRSFQGLEKQAKIQDFAGGIGTLIITCITTAEEL